MKRSKQKSTDPEITAADALLLSKGLIVYLNSTKAEEMIVRHKEFRNIKTGKILGDYEVIVKKI